jgi:signal transduction histidine kinase
MGDAADASGSAPAPHDVALLDAVSDAVVLIDRVGRVIYANPAARAVGEPALPPDARHLTDAVLRGGKPAESIADGWWRRAIPGPDGGVRLIARRVRGAPDGTPGSLYELFEHSPIAMLVLQSAADGGVTIEGANTMFCRTTGLAADIAGRPIEAALGAETGGVIAAEVRTCLLQGGFECQQSLHYPAGELTVRTYYRRMPDAAGGPRRVLLTQIDLTETRKIEAALRQALRLEAVGQLTGGVAHDFNNLLTTVLGNLDLLASTLTEERQLRWLQMASQAAQRGATLTHQLLSYARKQFLAPTATDIPGLIGGMTELIRGSLVHGSGGQQIAMEADFDPATWLAHADAAQLELALLNLVANARAAMPRGGRLVLTTRNLAADDPALPQELEPGAYVMLAVTDTGVGMAPDVLARAMEPFFTTRGIGEGSGLGLSQAYGFARQLGGTVRLHSKPGAGTTAEIFLPRSTEPLAVRILLVDADGAARRVAAALLRAGGWMVDEAGVMPAGGAHGVLVADVDTPGVADAVGQAAVPVVLLGSRAGAMDFSGEAVLVKPYTPQALLHAVRGALERVRCK